jgi:hypothetical protein
LKSELGKAIDWRCHIGAAVRGGETIQWPVVAGETGIIGRIQIRDVNASGVVTATGELFQPMTVDAKQTEGITTVRGRAVPAVFVINGWNDDTIAAGQTVFLDKMMRVVSARTDGERMLVRVERFPCDDDAILDDFREFRKPDEGAFAQR